MYLSGNIEIENHTDSRAYGQKPQFIGDVGSRHGTLCQEMSHQHRIHRDPLLHSKRHTGSRKEQQKDADRQGAVPKDRKTDRRDGQCHNK